MENAQRAGGLRQGEPRESSRRAFRQGQPHTHCECGAVFRRGRQDHRRPLWRGPSRHQSAGRAHRGGGAVSAGVRIAREERRLAHSGPARHHSRSGLSQCENGQAAGL